MKHSEIEQFVRELAFLSGDVIRPYFAKRDLKVDHKLDESPVTEADRRAELVMRELIRDRYPNHGIIGEEFGSENEDAPFVWVLDPIDGTRPFTVGCPLFGTLICLLENGRPVFGAVHNPVLSQLLTGDNSVTTLNGDPVSVGNTSKLEEATLLVSNLESPELYQNGEKWRTLSSRVESVFTWGDCYGYLLVASGGADIMVDPIMNPWALLALVPIIRGAGGVITDWQGGDPVVGNSIIASNPVIHPQVLAILNP